MFQECISLEQILRIYKSLKKILLYSTIDQIIQKISTIQSKVTVNKIEIN